MHGSVPGTSRPRCLAWLWLLRHVLDTQLDKSMSVLLRICGVMGVMPCWRMRRRPALKPYRRSRGSVDLTALAALWPQFAHIYTFWAEAE